MDFSEHTTLPNCPECSTPIGHPHKPGCDVERCPACFRQTACCDCLPRHDTVWTGERPDTLSDATTRLHDMLGMTGEWDNRSLQFILRSPSGFPLALVTLWRKTDGRWQFEFGQPVENQRSWLEAEEWLGGPCPCCGARNRQVLKVLEGLASFYDESDYEPPCDVRTIRDALLFENWEAEEELEVSIRPLMQAIPEVQKELLRSHVLPRTAEDKVDWNSIIDKLEQYRGRF